MARVMKSKFAEIGRKMKDKARIVQAVFSAGVGNMNLTILEGDLLNI